MRPNSGRIVGLLLLTIGIVFDSGAAEWGPAADGAELGGLPSGGEVVAAEEALALDELTGVAAEEALVLDELTVEVGPILGD